MCLRMRMRNSAHLERDGDLGADERGEVAERAIHRDGRGRAAGVGVDDVRERARVYAPVVAARRRVGPFPQR